MFCQITADEEQYMSQCNVMVQHPSLVFPQFRPHPSNVLKLPGTTVVQIHDGQCLSNQKTQPTSS